MSKDTTPAPPKMGSSESWTLGPLVKMRINPLLSVRNVIFLQFFLVSSFHKGEYPRLCLVLTGDLWVQFESYRVDLSSPDDLVLGVLIMHGVCSRRKTVLFALNMIRFSFALRDCRVTLNQMF